MWHLQKLPVLANTGRMAILNGYLPGLEESLILVGLEVDERRKQQNHVATLIHYRAVTIRAADLARELVLDGLLGRIVPLQLMVAVGEVDILLMEDGCPLEWCSYQLNMSTMLMHPRQAFRQIKSLTYRAVSGRLCNDTACCPAAPSY
jgi:hypothetical protein